MSRTPYRRVSGFRGIEASDEEDGTGDRLETRRIGGRNVIKEQRGYLKSAGGPSASEPTSTRRIDFQSGLTRKANLK